MEYIRRTHEEAFRIWKNFRFPVDQRTKPSEFLASPCERIEAEAQNGQSDQVKFDVPESGNVNATNSSKDASHRQRNRFRCLFRNLFPANTDTGPPNQEKPIAPEVSALKVDLESNQSIIPNHDVNELNVHGGVEGRTENELPSTSTTYVSPTSAGALLVKNRFSPSSAKGFTTFVWEALQCTVIVILAACALLSLAVRPFKERWPMGAYCIILGLSMVTSILVSVFVVATKMYRKYSFGFKDLDREKIKIAVQVPGQAASSTSRDTTKLLDFPTPSSRFSNDLISLLIANLASPSIEVQKKAATMIRVLTKDNSEDRLKVAKSDHAIKSLISLLSSYDPELQEKGVTLIQNLSLREESKELMVSPEAIMPLVQVLRTGTSTAKSNTASALFHLSQGGDDRHRKMSIGEFGAIPLLVRLLKSRCTQENKDAATALYSLCLVGPNKLRAVEAGIMKPLVKFLAKLDADMAEKSAWVLSRLVSLPVAIADLVEQQGIPALVKTIEKGWRRLKEVTVAILLLICKNNEACCTMLAHRRDSMIRGLEPRSQFSDCTNQKANTLIELLSIPGSENTTARA